MCLLGAQCPLLSELLATEDVGCIERERMKDFDPDVSLIGDLNIVLWPLRDAVDFLFPSTLLPTLFAWACAIHGSIPILHNVFVKGHPSAGT